MKLSVLVIFILYFFLNATHSFSQSPSWLWAKRAGGSYGDFATAVANDTSGNVFVAGYYESDSISFGTYKLRNPSATSNSATADLFIVKYSSSGNVVWAKSATEGAPGTERARALAVDDSGNVYVAGVFDCPYIVFDMDTLHNTNTTSSRTYDIFIVKYDANGVLQWSKKAGRFGDDYISSIEMNKTSGGGFFMAGNFESYSIIFGSDTLWNINAGTPDIYLVKYDANGDEIWAKSAIGNDYDEISSIATDIIGNVIITGIFLSDSIAFDSIHLFLSQPLPNAYDQDMFLVKYDSAGSVTWAKKIGGVEGELSGFIDTDDSANIYLAGNLVVDTLMIDSIAVVHTSCSSACNSDIFLSKFNSNGNAVWARSARATGNDIVTCISVSSTSQNLFLGGWTDSDSLTFGAFSYGINSITGADRLLILKSDLNGFVNWAYMNINSYYDFVSDVSVCENGEAFFAGSFTSNPITFGFSSLSNIYTPRPDMYIAKLGNGTSVGTYPDIHPMKVEIFPNPAKDNLIITLELDKPQRMNINIYDVNGRLVKEYTSQLEQSKTQISVRIAGLSEGIYSLKILLGELWQTTRLVVVK